MDDSFNEFRRLSGIERNTGALLPGIYLRVIVGSPGKAVLWGLQLPAESAKRAGPSGEIEPRALFDLGIELLSLALQTKWRRTIARGHER